MVGLCDELGSSFKFRGNDRDDNEGMGQYSLSHDSYAIFPLRAQEN